jgi:hypothetical protein
MGFQGSFAAGGAIFNVARPSDGEEVGPAARGFRSPDELSRSSLVARSAPLLPHDVAVSSEPNPGSEPDPDR